LSLQVSLINYLIVFVPMLEFLRMSWFWYLRRIAKKFTLWDCFGRSGGVVFQNNAPPSVPANIDLVNVHANKKGQKSKITTPGMLCQKRRQY